ncbi:hypothetical protein SAMN02927937_02342 [Paenimyroides aquimaris]|uniref:Uncharacterized protein n=1 Tax=Paenimyroides marinum TaxID=1159016 RepID=A0A1H6M1P7_9FLAO|nr:hypothetical protein SAMN02927937_02342 [Paenimyroides aquimaris]
MMKMLIFGNGDTVSYEGKWEIADNKPLLHIHKNSYYLQHSNISKKVYYIEFLRSCQDTTKGVFFYNVFKKKK